MQWSATGLGGTCLFILGLGGGAWVFPGDVTPAQSRERTPTEVIAFRFPGKWEATQPQSSTSVATEAPQRVASLEPVSIEAPYALASADTYLPVGFQRSLSKEQTEATQALAYAAPEPEIAAAAVERATQPHERRTHVSPMPKPVKQSSNLFPIARSPPSARNSSSRRNSSAIGRPSPPPCVASRSSSPAARAPRSIRTVAPCSSSNQPLSR